MKRDDFEQLDITSLGDTPVTIHAEVEPEDASQTCASCGGKLMKNTEMQTVCFSCGVVSDEKAIDPRDRVAYDMDQVKNRTTQSPVTYLMYDKNLGSQIGFGKHAVGTSRLRRINRISEGSEEREMKDFLRDMTIIADSRMMALTRHEVEDLVIAYRKKFLGKKISIGRSRFVVNVAFAFLELRAMKGREYLSIDEFIDKITQSASKDKVVAISDQSKTGNLDDKKQFRERLTSSIFMFVKVHGYKFSQPSLDAIIRHVVMNMNVKIPAVPVARDAIRIGDMVLPCYKMKGIKYSGLAGALIKLACVKNGCNVQTVRIVENIHGVTSPITVKERVEEVITFLEKHLVNMMVEANTTTSLTRMQRLSNDITLVSAIIDASRKRDKSC